MNEYRTIKQSLAKQNLEGDCKITVLDVRRPDEYALLHIPESLNIPNYEISTKAPTFLPDKNAIIYVHCKSGTRSRGVVLMLMEMGYTNVYDMGGIISWPYRTVKG